MSSLFSAFIVHYLHKVTDVSGDKKVLHITPGLHIMIQAYLLDPPAVSAEKLYNQLNTL